MRHLKPVHAYIGFAVVVVLVLGKDQARQYDNQISGCERGNVIRESVANNSRSIRSNLRAAIKADATNENAVATYRENIAVLNHQIDVNGPINCEDTISKPRYLP